MEIEDLSIFIGAFGLCAGYAMVQEIKKRRKYTEALKSLSNNRVCDVHELPEILAKDKTNKFQTLQTFVFRARLSSPDELKPSSFPKIRALVVQKKTFDYFDGNSISNYYSSAETKFCLNYMISDVKYRKSDILLMADIKPYLLDNLSFTNMILIKEKKGVIGSVTGKAVNSAALFMSGLLRRQVLGSKVGVVEKESFVENGASFIFLGTLFLNPKKDQIHVLSVHCLAQTIEAFRYQLSKKSQAHFWRILGFGIITSACLYFTGRVIMNYIRLFRGKKKDDSITWKIEKLKCPKCLKEVRDVIGVPCNHLTFCADCFGTLSMLGPVKCPECSKKVSNNIRVYFN